MKISIKNISNQTKCLFLLTLLTISKISFSQKNTDEQTYCQKDYSGSKYELTLIFDRDSREKLATFKKYDQQDILLNSLEGTYEMEIDNNTYKTYYFVYFDDGTLRFESLNSWTLVDDSRRSWEKCYPPKRNNKSSTQVVKPIVNTVPKKVVSTKPVAKPASKPISVTKPPVKKSN